MSLSSSDISKHAPLVTNVKEDDPEISAAVPDRISEIDATDGADDYETAVAVMGTDPKIGTVDTPVESVALSVDDNVILGEGTKYERITETWIDGLR